MQLTALQLLHFKNWPEADLAFCSGVNCLLGDNGSGKTNVLDAVHYLCLTKSYFNPIDQYNIAHGAEHMLVSGTFERRGEVEVVACGVQRGVKKTMRRNDKAYDRLSDHIGRFPAVMIAPDDASIIHEGSDARRKWMDSVVCQLDRPYLQQLVDYNKALTQRNNLLRYFAENRVWDVAMLEPWTEQMIPTARAIRARRSAFVAAFNPMFERVYAELSGRKEQARVVYKTHVPDEDEAARAMWRGAEADDRRLRRTTVGVHKDDLVFELDGHPLKRMGSQGQQKSFLIALRLAQLAFMEAATGVKPILLLDDIFDKIDDKRVAALMDLVTRDEVGQVFITDTSLGRIPDLFREAGADVRVFEVVRGAAERVDLAQPTGPEKP